MPPIIIACGCAFQHGSGFFGAGHGLNSGWPVSHFAATAANATPVATPAPAPPVAPEQTAMAVPAGGISFAVETSATTERSEDNPEPGPSS
jgi:hypothetical protein